MRQPRKGGGRYARWMRLSSRCGSANAWAVIGFGKIITCLDFNGVRTCPHRDAVGAPAHYEDGQAGSDRAVASNNTRGRGARGDRVSEEDGWSAGLGVDLHVPLFGAAQQPDSE